MEITEVRVKLMDEPGERLQAFCSITFDDAFVVRDLKIIEGTTGPFVAMPSRKLTAHCPQCGCKNHLRAAHCNQCGGRLKEAASAKDDDGRAKLYADIAHPINSALPRDDPAAGDSGVRGREGPLEAAGLCAQLRRFRARGHRRRPLRLERQPRRRTSKRPRSRTARTRPPRISRSRSGWTTITVLAREFSTEAGSRRLCFSITRQPTMPTLC